MVEQFFLERWLSFHILCCIQPEHGKCDPRLSPSERRRCGPRKVLLDIAIVQIRTVLEGSRNRGSGSLNNPKREEERLTVVPYVPKLNQRFISSIPKRDISPSRVMPSCPDKSWTTFSRCLGITIMSSRSLMYHRVCERFSSLVNALESIHSPM